MAIRSPCPTRRGLTLIELLIATVVMSVLMLAVYHAFSAGLAACKRANTDLEILHQGRTLLSNLCSELASASAPAVGELPVFQASVGQLAFFTNNGLSDRSVKASGGTTRIVYEFIAPHAAGGALAVAGEEGLVGPLTIRRARQFYSGSQSISSESGAVIFSGAGRIELLYLTPDATALQPQWQRAWENPEPPRAVRINLILQSPLATHGKNRLLRLSTSVVLPGCQPQASDRTDEGNQREK